MEKGLTKGPVDVAHCRLPIALSRSLDVKMSLLAILWRISNTMLCFCLAIWIIGPAGWITNANQVLMGPRRVFFQLRGVRKASRVARRAHVCSGATVDRRSQHKGPAHRRKQVVHDPEVGPKAGLTPCHVSQLCWPTSPRQSEQSGTSSQSSRS